jgi:inosine-uridine nucleoside N-ribohydrolase
MMGKAVHMMQFFFQRILVVMLLVFVSHQAWSAGDKLKLIIDSDPGIDDALALTLALQYPGFEIMRITTTFGNADLEQATQNALRIIELSGQSIPVYKGAGKPSVVEADAPTDIMHGEDGLGNTHLPIPLGHAESLPAAQFLVDMARQYPGQITVVALGRLTNLAQAIKQDPNFAKNIQQVVLVGGTLHTPGNISPVAEANIAGDPHAADIVFTAPWQVSMVGLDVTTKVRVDDKMLTRIKARNQRFGEFVYATTRYYAGIYPQQQSKGGFYVYAPSAMVYLIEPELFKIQKGPVRVVTDGIAIGQTIMAAEGNQAKLPSWKDQPMVTAAIDIDKVRFEKYLETLLLGEWPLVADVQRSKTN